MSRPLSMEKALPPLPAYRPESSSTSAARSTQSLHPSQPRPVVNDDDDDVQPLHTSPASSSRSSTTGIPITPAPPLERDLAKPFTLRFAPSRSTTLCESEPSSSAAEKGLTHPESTYTASKVFKGSGTSSDPYVVEWLPGESANPYNWKKGFKWLLTVHLAINCLCPVFISSAYVAGVEDIVVKFRGTSTELGIAGLSLYLIGQACGPLFWAPLSEIIGRRYAFLVSFPIFVLFNLGGALSNNVASILVTRFFAGMTGASQLSNLAGQMADIWVPHERLVPGGLAALSPLLGPVLGPSIGGFVAEYSGWRAIFWMQFGFAATMLVLWIAFVPETYGPTLLSRRAQQLQALADEMRTGEHFAIAHRGTGTKGGVWAKLKIGLARPFILLFTEVIVLTLSLYISIVYGILYLLFTAYPIVFQQLRHWSLGLSGLALFGIGVGMIIGFFLNGLGAAIYAKAHANLPPGQAPPPEVRLPTMILGGILVPNSLFIFAWTATPNVPWPVPIVFSSLFGAGYLLIFTAIILYLIDSYALHAASAVAANSVMRCAFGAAFPLFSTQMFDALGVHWACSLLAFLALACVPMPFLFYKFGPYLRRKSRYAPSAPVTLALTTTPLSQNGTSAGEMKTSRSKYPLNQADSGEPSGSGVIGNDNPNGEVEEEEDMGEIRVSETRRWSTVPDEPPFITPDRWSIPKFDIWLEDSASEDDGTNRRQGGRSVTPHGSGPLGGGNDNGTERAGDVLD